MWKFCFQIHNSVPIKTPKLKNQKVSDQSAILNYFQKRVFDNAQLISILDWQEKNHATFTETVYYSISLNE